MSSYGSERPINLKSLFQGQHQCIGKIVSAQLQTAIAILPTSSMDKYISHSSIAWKSMLRQQALEVEANTIPLIHNLIFYNSKDVKCENTGVWHYQVGKLISLTINMMHSLALCGLVKHNQYSKE